MGVHEISHGDVASAIVSPRAVFMRALLNNASAIILVHSHPRGNCNPSDEDIQLTKRINDASEIISISLLDHVIVGNENFFSFKENGLL